VYATKVDEKDALEFFGNFFGEYDQMKSVQGRLFNSLGSSNYGFKILMNPIDDLFDEHTITFSDGSKFSYHLGFVNKNVPSGTRDDLWLKDPKKCDESDINETEIIDIIKNMDKMKRQKRDAHIYAECGMIGNMNYISIPTFSPDSSSMFVVEFMECIESFDENDKPITVILPYNPGGSTALRELIQFFLMPASDSRTFRAARKTSTTRYLSVEKEYISIQNPSNCDGLINQELAQFWNISEHDDFGNGVIHTRTKKFIESFKNQFYPIAQFGLKKHVRKPTEIILATDGFCFSSCAFFVDNAIRSGSAIVTGYGVTMPGDEVFVAGQCPSRVVNPAENFDDLNDLNDEYGISFQSTFLESYNFSTKMDEKIPADYDILRIDKHCGYMKNNNPVFTDLLKHTTAVYEEFKTKCNPANKRLFLVSDECKSKDKNALYSGYVCGENGEWDKSKCKISGCKPGYVVDFDQDKCVPHACDPRAASSSLYPMITIIVAALAIALHSIF